MLISTMQHAYASEKTEKNHHNKLIINRPLAEQYLKEIKQIFEQGEYYKKHKFRKKIICPTQQGKRTAISLQYKFSLAGQQVKLQRWENHLSTVGGVSAYLPVQMFAPLPDDLLVEFLEFILEKTGSLEKGAHKYCQEEIKKLVKDIQLRKHKK